MDYNIDDFENYFPFSKLGLDSLMFICSLLVHTCKKSIISKKKLGKAFMLCLKLKETVSIFENLLLFVCNVYFKTIPC